MLNTHRPDNVGVRKHSQNNFNENTHCVRKLSHRHALHIQVLWGHRGLIYRFVASSIDETRMIWRRNNLVQPMKMSSANELWNYTRCESALPTGAKHARAVMADSFFPFVKWCFHFRNFAFRLFNSKRSRSAHLMMSTLVSCPLYPLDSVFIVTASSLFSLLVLLIIANRQCYFVCSAYFSLRYIGNARSR